MESNDDDSTLEGFVIQCGDSEEEVAVTAEQAEKMAQKCAYFRNVFAHGTRESGNRILKKPDWCTATAKCIVELASTGRTCVGDFNSYMALTDASSQVLLELEGGAHHGLIPSVVTKSSIPSDTSRVESIIELYASIEAESSAVKVAFETSQKIAFDAWVDLVLLDILVADKVPKFEVKIKGGSVSKQSSDFFDFFRELSMGRKSIMLLSTQCCIGTVIRHVCRKFHEHCKSNQHVFTREEVSLRIPCGLFSGSGIKTKIQRETQARCYARMANSPGYYLDGGSCAVVTITGTCQQLQSALNAIPEELLPAYSGTISPRPECKRCSLRLSAPSQDTLKRLVMACQLCQDNPGTLGFDMGSNAFYAVKTVHDMKAILCSMARISDTATDVPPISGQTFKLVDLTYPEGVF